MTKSKLTFLKVAMVAVFGFTAVMSCKKDISLIKKVINESKDEQLYQTLIKNGVKAENIKDIGEYYLIEGDMLFKKNKTDLKKVSAYFGNANENIDLIQMQQNNAKNGKIASANIPNKIEQWSTSASYNVSSLNLERISYNNLQAVYGWKDAIELAIAEWSSIPNFKIGFYFNEYMSSFNINPNTNTNGIIFLDDNGILPNTALAAAEFPSSGNVGYKILINGDFYNNYPVTNSGKLYNMVHEIGHCIGFRHSNWQADVDEYGASVGAVQIAGTPSTDANSVMNGGTPFNQWLGFSIYDIIAAQTLYPNGTYDKWLREVGYFVVYNNDFPPAIEWNYNLVNTNTISLEIFQHGVSMGMIAQNVPNNGSYSVDYTSFPKQGNFNKQGVQIKIISDANPNITDMTKAFNFYQD